MKTMFFFWTPESALELPHGRSATDAGLHGGSVYSIRAVHTVRSIRSHVLVAVAGRSYVRYRCSCSA